MAEIQEHFGASGTRADLVARFRSGKRGGRGGQSANANARLSPAQIRANKRAGSFLSRAGGGLMDWGGGMASRLLSNVQIEQIRHRLMRGGFPMGLKATQFAFIKWLAMVGMSFLFAVALPGTLASVLGMEETPMLTLMSFGVGALYGFKAPDVWLNVRTRQRQTEIQLALPDMIDLITVSVEAGLGLAAAIQRVSSRFPSALAEEFIRTMGEVHLGRSQADSLREMAKRLEVPDLTTFLTALVQAETLGLPIANVLRVQSERLREKRAQRARETAQKAPVKMIFPLVFFIFPAIFIVILGPAAIKIMDSGM